MFGYQHFSCIANRHMRFLACGDISDTYEAPTNVSFGAFLFSEALLSEKASATFVGAGIFHYLGDCNAKKQCLGP